MTNPTDIIAFIEARLDHDERVALEAVRWSEGCTDWADDGNPDWVHIARHDPAAVLRDVQAMRLILRQHNVWTTIYPEDANREWNRTDRHCVGCGFDNMEEPATSDVNDCPTLRAVASRWSTHADYRPEWRPEQ